MNYVKIIIDNKAKNKNATQFAEKIPWKLYKQDVSITEASRIHSKSQNKL